MQRPSLWDQLPPSSWPSLPTPALPAANSLHQQQQLLQPLGQPGAPTATVEDERRLGVVGSRERSCRAAASSLVLWSRLLSSSRHLPPGPPGPEQAPRSLPSAFSSIHAAPSQETLFCCLWPLVPSPVCHILCILPLSPFCRERSHRVPESEWSSRVGTARGYSLWDSPRGHLVTEGDIEVDGETEAQGQVTPTKQPPWGSLWVLLWGSRASAETISWRVGLSGPAPPNVPIATCPAGSGALDGSPGGLVFGMAEDVRFGVRHLDLPFQGSMTWTKSLHRSTPWWLRWKWVCSCTDDSCETRVS